MLQHNTIRIDQDTFESLEVLKEKLNSPKAWIIRRLVAEEMKRVRQLEKQKIEVTAR